MLSDDRRKQIFGMLKEQKHVQVPELARHFFTSEATIRRDLDKLKKTGVLRRTYGGAALVEGIDADIPLAVREEERAKEKEIIAQIAAGLIRTGDVIIVDSSSTSAKLIPHLFSIQPKTVITNNPKTAIALSKSNDIKIYSTGGLLRSASLSYVGEPARSMISSFFADTLFFSCRGASLDIGLTDPSEEEAELKRVMLAHAKTKVAMLDSHKMRQNGFSRVCGFCDIDYFITDKKPSNDWLVLLSSQGVTVLHPGCVAAEHKRNL
jgi:DeoR/GlpR family transcriptional regulator of sugar metabolism